MGELSAEVVVEEGGEVPEHRVLADESSGGEERDPQSFDLAVGARDLERLADSGEDRLPLRRLARDSSNEDSRVDKVGVEGAKEGVTDVRLGLDDGGRVDGDAGLDDGGGDGGDEGSGGIDADGCGGFERGAKEGRFGSNDWERIDGERDGGGRGDGRGAKVLNAAFGRDDGSKPLKRRTRKERRSSSLKSPPVDAHRFGPHPPLVVRLVLALLHRSAPRQIELLEPNALGSQQVDATAKLDIEVVQVKAHSPLHRLGRRRSDLRDGKTRGEKRAADDLVRVKSVAVA